MSELLPIIDHDAFALARTSWHAVAEHVLAKVRWVETGRIGLRVVPGGVGTPHFDDDRRALLVFDTIVREQYGEQEAAPLTTLRAAAAWVGVEPGAPADVYAATTALDLDAMLVVDGGAARVLASWYAFADAVLQAWRVANSQTARAPSLVQLWPEHFDLAVDLGDAEAGARANYGASPGDAAIPDPYLYVGPWDAARIAAGADGFWNQPWGAALTYDQLLAAPDPAHAAQAFFAHGQLRLEQPGSTLGGPRRAR